MRIIYHDDRVLVLGLKGMLTLIIGLGIVIASFFATRAIEGIPRLMGLFSFAIGFSVVITGILERSNIWTFDRGEGQITYQYRTLFKNNTFTYRMTDVIGVRIFTGRSSHWVELPTRNEEVIFIGPRFGLGKQEAKYIARLVHAFLYTKNKQETLNEIYFLS